MFLCMLEISYCNPLLYRNMALLTLTSCHEGTGRVLELRKNRDNK